LLFPDFVVFRSNSAQSCLDSYNCLIIQRGHFLKSVLAVASATLTLAYYGVDVSQPTSVSAFQCLHNNGASFAIVRVFQSNGVVDVNGPGTIGNAWAGGISYVDGYIFPCYSCGNPSGQMDTTIDYLASHSVRLAKMGENRTESTLGATIGMLWIDVEGTQYWGSSTSSNTDFIAAIAQRGRDRGYNIGVYTSNSQWGPITGGSTALSSYPLWYPHYDNNPSYSDWYNFGGWTKPSIKQYTGTTSTCGASVDQNFY